MEHDPSGIEQLLLGQFNTGQDGQMQMLRSGPGSRTLQTLSETGAPFDTSKLFQALAPVRDRQLQTGIASLRGGAPGIGQRFGSAQMASERQFAGEHLQNIAAQDAATSFQAHEAAQARRLQASQFGVGAQQNLLNLLFNAENARKGRNVQLFGAQAGIPQAPGVNFGQPFTDFGQLMLLKSLFPGGTTSASPYPVTQAGVGPHPV